MMGHSKRVWVAIGGFVGLVAICGVLVAIAQLFQAQRALEEQEKALTTARALDATRAVEQDKVATNQAAQQATSLANQANVNESVKTQVALQEQQLEAQRLLLTAQAKTPETASTATALAQGIAQIAITSEAIEIQRRSVEATQTASARPTPTQKPTTVLVPSVPTFSQVDLRPIANWPIDYLVNPLSGSVSFANIPFTILTGEKSNFQTQHGLLMELPTQGKVEVNIDRPIAIHILLNAEYLYNNIPGYKVGEIDLSFVNGSTLNTPIIAYQSVRDAWEYESKADDALSSQQPMSAPLDGIEWRNVWVENQMRGGEPAKAYIDMLTIFVTEPLASSTLTSITIKDTSVDTVESTEPSLRVMGITVESR